MKVVLLTDGAGGHAGKPSVPELPAALWMQGKTSSSSVSDILAVPLSTKAACNSLWVFPLEKSYLLECDL